MTKREAIAATIAVSEARAVVKRLNNWGRADVIDKVNRALRNLETRYHKHALKLHAAQDARRVTLARLRRAK